MARLHIAAHQSRYKETMNQKFPFILNNAFFVTVEFCRTSQMENEFQFEAKVDLKVVTEQLPQRLQLNLKFESEDALPVRFKLELVALFDLVEGYPEADRNTIVDFINERALFSMWPYISQMSRLMTSQMGMNPVNWRMPQNFEFEAPSKDWPFDEEEQES